MFHYKNFTRNSIITGILINLIMTIVFIVFISLGYRTTSENAAIQDDTFRTHFQSRLILKSINGLNHSRADILLAMRDNNLDQLDEAENKILGAKSNYQLLMSEQTLNRSRISDAFEGKFRELQSLFDNVTSKKSPLQDKNALKSILEKTSSLIDVMYEEESKLWIDEAFKLHEFSKGKELNQEVFYALTFCFILIQVMFVYFTIVRYKLNRKISQQQERLIMQTRLSTLGMMSAELAHEINTPLMVIDGRMRILHNELINSNNNNEKLHKNIEIIKRNSKRIQNIIKSFKTMSKSGEHDSFEPIELSTLFEEVQDVVGQKLKDEQVSLSLGDMNANFWVEARRIQIVQVLTNLVNNSLDAIRGTTQPWINIAGEIKDDDKLVISVTDSGPGIKEEHILNIFDPFYSTKNSTQGTGLGLSISKKIMKEHGGNLTYNTESDHTQFILTFKYNKETQVFKDGPPPQ
jgi:signal transduction histidine kinase